MPGFDGTGPMGQGPMTGWRRGYCAVPLTGTRRPFFGRGFWGRGSGRGFFGRGGSRGFRNRFWATGLTGWERTAYARPSFVDYPYSSDLTPEQEMDMLKQEADALKTQLDDIQNRIESLKKNERSVEPNK